MAFVEDKVTADDYGLPLTYVVHSQKQHSGHNPDVWILHQSNVHGIVVAESLLSEDASDQYPKIDGAVAEHFIPEVTVVEDDFTEVKVRSSKRRLVTRFSDVCNKLMALFSCALHNEVGMESM